MRKLMVSKIWIPAFLLAVFVAGCGDSDKAGGPGSPLTPPTVPAGSVTPTVGATLVCRNTPGITATFSKAMNPATINSPATSFTLADPSGANVPGTASLDSTGLVATLTPTSPLLVSTAYTATITTGAADTFGNHLAANFTWSFTTSSSPGCLPPVGAVSLGGACGYGILAGSTVTVTPTGPTMVTGDVGLSPGSSMTGWSSTNTFAPANTGMNIPGTGIVTGTIHIKDAPPSPNDAKTAQTDLTTAYLDLAGRTAPAPILLVLPSPAAPDIGGQTLAPGIYKSNTSLGITGTVFLDGGGDPNAVWIFQISSTLITASGSNVNLTNGANAHNVFWQVGSSATLGTTSIFNGSILALTSITLNTGATMTGRALARNGAVTLDDNKVTITSCP
jgi:hypothetical protein